jgi:hypothetical protein
MSRRVDITLSGDDAEWFEAKRERYAEELRDGELPSRSEFTRLLLEDFDRLP